MAQPPAFAVPVPGGGQPPPAYVAQPTIAAIPPQQPPQQQPQPPQPQQQPQPPPPPPPRSSSKSKPRLEDSVLTTRMADEETEDGRIRNREAIQKIRDTWIYKQVRARQDEFTQYREASLYVGTWNVNAKGKEESLEEWICADWNRGAQQPDLVAVGFQEIVDLNAVNVAVDNKTQQRASFWTERLNRTLNDPKYHQGDPNRQYVLLLQKPLVGLLICVFVKRIHQARVRYVHAASVGVGVMGVMGNKGGVSVRLQLYDSTFCFICSHLAAHRENVTGRNADFMNVYNKTVFDIGQEAIQEVIRSGALSHFAVGSSTVGIPDHDIVVWLGDLNYRIDESMPTEKVLQHSERNVLGELVKLDQLNVERAAGRVFDGFEEGALRFPPTYKYQPGTDVYEQRPEKKLRAPAWCDRILWMAQDASHVQQMTYNRAERPNVSDHKAVYSTMRVTIKDVVQEKREAIYKQLQGLLDRYKDSRSMPTVALDRVHLDYGPVRYGQTVSLPIHITNTGSVLAQWRLVPKPDEMNICKPWMQVSPTFGMLIPGDKPARIEFKFTIDNSTAQLLNSGRDTLDDILILRLENGRSFFITVKAEFCRSCFGMTVDELVMYPEPIRKIPIDPVARTKMLGGAAGTPALCVPKELWRTIDAVYEKGVQEPGIFSEPGVAEEVQSIRESLDTGAPFEPCRVHSYAEVLVSFLSSLALPIIPEALFPSVEIDSQNIQASARRLLEELPPIHYNCFVYVISFFREVLVHRNANQLTPAKVARVCCSCMAPGQGLDASNASLQKRTGIQLVILHLLETSSI